MINTTAASTITNLTVPVVPTLGGGENLSHFRLRVDLVTSRDKESLRIIGTQSHVVKTDVAPL